ncbi:unnamed protein product [Penicillium nalgiovense]|uniref:Uncharacterized protein n=1 Tax=Penicillium nalgiovense TaxID=60175 RepID=A0A1V6XU95_PENNA|nr:hypothetical protein PENNAL_c0054G11421 [Penicillium nalgiovense]CAG7949354.1 unnamed protein product [Penicillium nalgiovense]CAG7972588.1 unnamed protein product [Penicillium nalgiovense]CAG8035738.1 unnamed protein product [Penicillium nalgiovense]CAG8045817.1 unnamed protein product [Penicillium nalgiovense]
MSGSNPFRPRNPGNPTYPADPLSTNSGTFAPALSSKPLPTPPIPPNGYPRKSSTSLEREVDDTSSSDEEINPFNPDVSGSDSEDESNGYKSPAPREDDRPRESFGSAPHPAPSTDGSPISPDHNRRSETGADSFPLARPAARLSVELDANSSFGRAKDKKPPPPPRSHHGRRIGSTATAESYQTARSRSTNRLSIHGSENVTPGASHPSSVSLSSTTDYFSVSGATGSTDSLQRSQFHKRPPTPPLSRRHSQMRRSKSTQSKTSSRLNMSYDSESNDGSLPPSPGPSSRALQSKRISMPPPSSGDFQTTVPLGDISLNLSPPTNSSPSSSLKAGRRVSSYGGVPSGSTGPPPPPPPRRTRDSIARSNDVMGLKENQTPVPQPSNALDILADLSKLQKEVDDLRGHYENRKVRD